MRCSSLVLRTLALLVVLTVIVAPAAADSAEAVQQRELQDCPTTVCDKGGTIGVPGVIVPLFPDGGLNCSTVEALLAASDPTVCSVLGEFGSYLDFGALCGCSGSTPPNSCKACTAGGSVTDSSLNFTVALLGDLTFTCGQGAAVLGYFKSTVACQAFTSFFDEVCCSADGVTTNSPAGMSPSMMPAAMMPSGMTTMTPTAKMMPSSATSMAPNMEMPGQPSMAPIVRFPATGPTADPTLEPSSLPGEPTAPAAPTTPEAPTTPKSPTSKPKTPTSSVSKPSTAPAAAPPGPTRPTSGSSNWIATTTAAVLLFAVVLVQVA